ncbi:ABC transporter substrate-binding protein [Propioniciclava sinopodophylli]|uniref:ABC transporter substrate-binding protein n=1 Tax=Propioniciclava sinopodophylli TaxID=1837344 RepID=UPI0024919473|nr:ABC transporter substrate-binding protein [Propioniciclava sinopodophylli]
MKRILTGLAAATVGLAMLAGCSGGAGTAQAPQGDTIKIGLNYELSGDVATYGEASVQGIELAAEEVNAAGGIDGKKIELVKYDTKSDAAEATTLATKLMTQDKVITVIGPATSGGMKATIPVAERQKVPVVSGSATADDVTVDGNGVKQFAFRTCFNDSFQGTAAANYAVKKFSAKKAVILRDSSSDYSKGLADAFRETFTAGGGEIVSEDAFAKGADNFNAVMTKFKGQQFDVIYLPGYYTEAGKAIKQARDLGVTQPILGADGFDSPVLAEQAGAQLKDVYFTNHYSSADQDPKVQDFIKAFEAKYSAEPNAFNALGYDTLKFVADGVSRATEKTGEGVQKALAETKGFAGVTGTFDVDENHNPVKAVVFIGYDKDGKLFSEKG